ncbi:MAG TPA: MFS transporter [Rectinemataceae bacterium]|nr:MFS transporter [Rectinemataceae bacterium]
MRSLDAGKALPWILFLIFFSVLNETVFNVSTPAISSQFHLSPAGVSWMMTSFIVFFGIGTVVFGRLSDLFAIGRLLSIGIVIYAAASLLGFLGRDSYPLVLAARAIQGMGGSSLPALVMVIVARHFAPEIRGGIFGSIGSVVAFAAGFGPVIGGIIASRIGWAWLFLIPLLTLAALPFIGRLLPAEERRPGRIDLAGALLMALGLGSLMVFLTYLAWPWLLAAALFLLFFVLRLRLAREPFIDPSLFANRPFRRGVLAALVLFACLMSMFFALPLMLSREVGLGPANIGLILFPGAISGVFFGPLAGRLADGCGNRFVLRIGLGLFVSGLAALPFVMGLAPYGPAILLVAVNVGVTFFQTGLINGVSQTLSPEKTGVGMGLFNLSGFVAGALGTAIVGKILDARLLDFGGVLIAIALVFALAGGAYILSLAKTSARSCREAKPA